ncbi:MAG: ZIP family metal transporter [bacterium]
MIWLNTLLAVVLVSFLSLLGIVFFFIKEAWLKRLIFVLISVSVGSLFGDAFIHLLPESLKSISGTSAASFVLIGLLIFFILEKFVHWRHEHGDDLEETETHHEEGEHCEKVQPVGYVVLLGDGVHNFIDGVIIAVSFLAGPAVGWATTLAVVLHEIPQELGHFAILIHSGFSKTKALFYNFVSALTAILGAVVTLVFVEKVTSAIPYLLALAVGGFIYIAGSDLVPQLHKKTGIKDSFVQLISILIGVGLMFSLLLLE